MTSPSFPKPDALLELLEAVPATKAAVRRTWLDQPRTVLWKTILLAATTAAFVPVLLLRREAGAVAYVVLLVLVHVAGLFVLVGRVRRSVVAATRPGLAVRALALTVLFVLLWMAADGLGSDGPLFWGSLISIWLLHTAGVVVLHVRGRAAACPFLPSEVQSFA